MDLSSLDIAAIVPCHNEEGAIAKVVADLLAAVPTMRVFVYDNCSTDRTAEVAAAAGAIVRREERKGKGNVVRRAFADVEADVYVMIDGDDTYDAAALPSMIAALLKGPYDHVLGVRRDVQEKSSYRPGHEAGNKAFNRLTSRVFGTHVTDMLSGYRVFSRRFVKSFGFKERAAGTESKLNTFSDGFKILALIARLVRDERPVLFYGTLGFLTWVVAVALGIPIVWHFLEFGNVPRFPTLFLSIGLVTMGFLWMMLGVIQSGLRRARANTARLAYLAYPAVSRP